MQKLINKYFKNKTDSVHIQFFRYIFAGGFAAIVDVGFFMILAKSFSIDYRIAVFLSFTLGTITNFILSNAFIFDRKTLSLWTAIFRHYASSIGGLATNEAVLIFLIGTAKFDSLFFSKIIATGAAVLVNFTLIKYFAFNSNIKIIKQNVYE
ncbi:MAG: GtrA family protein [Parcubacteria group bacterium]|jgi:putative flippase GtrA